MTGIPKRKPRTFKVWALIDGDGYHGNLLGMVVNRPRNHFQSFVGSRACKYARATLTLTGKRKGSIT